MSTPNLKLLVCTRCHANEGDVPDTPAHRVTDLGLATVHYDTRDSLRADTIYVTPHHKTCPTLKWVFS